MFTCSNLNSLGLQELLLMLDPALVLDGEEDRQTVLGVRGGLAIASADYIDQVTC